MALKFLMKLAANQGVSKLQVLGDSVVVINWMEGSYRLHNLTLQPNTGTSNKNGV
jgi:hypothetical protein